MTPRPDGRADARPHYTIDSTVSPTQAWRAVAAHHLLASRHLPEATMSVVGVDERTARNLRLYAVELGLSGLQIPGKDPLDGHSVIKLIEGDAGRPAASQPIALEVPSRTPPSVLCEAVAIMLEAANAI